jgi:Tfp pilus assembly protein PilF
MPPWPLRFWGKTLRRKTTCKGALTIAPQNAAANFNMGLMAAEQKKVDQAEKHLRAALATDPKMHQAAYNLGLLLAKKAPAESLRHLSVAFQLRPNPKYGYTMAHVLHHNKDYQKAGVVAEFLTENGRAWLTRT